MSTSFGFETPEDYLMTKREVQERLKISQATLDRMRKTPAVNFPQPIRVSGTLRFSARELNKWIQQNTPSVDKLSPKELIKQFNSALNEDDA